MSQSSKKNLVVQEAVQHWKYVAPLLTFPKNDAEYNTLVAQLDQLLDIVGDDESHSLMSLIDILSNMIAAYDEKHISIKAKGIKALQYLMEIKQLTQADLSEIGSQGVVSELLNGKRKLNLRQIKVLSKKFRVSPETFIDDLD